MNLLSINYLHAGAPKYWYAIAPEDAKRFESLAEFHFAHACQKCPEFLRHKLNLLSPRILEKNGLPFEVQIQRPGDAIVTCAGAYHFGVNLGFNVAEATNFALPEWIPQGRKANVCMCRPHSVRIDMDRFEELYRQYQRDADSARQLGFPALTYRQWTLLEKKRQRMIEVKEEEDVEASWGRQDGSEQNDQGVSSVAVENGNGKKVLKPDKVSSKRTGSTKKKKEKTGKNNTPNPTPCTDLATPSSSSTTASTTTTTTALETRTEKAKTNHWKKTKKDETMRVTTNDRILNTSKDFWVEVFRPLTSQEAASATKSRSKRKRQGHDNNNNNNKKGSKKNKTMPTTVTREEWRLARPMSLKALVLDTAVLCLLKGKLGNNPEEEQCFAGVITEIADGHVRVHFHGLAKKEDVWMKKDSPQLFRDGGVFEEDKEYVYKNGATVAVPVSSEESDESS